jgi:hypothetical protein
MKNYVVKDTYFLGVMVQGKCTEKRAGEGIRPRKIALSGFVFYIRKMGEEWAFYEAVFSLLFSTALPQQSSSTPSATSQGLKKPAIMPRPAWTA